MGYADDVTIPVTAPEDISVIRNAIQCNEATSAVLNQALAVGTWDTKLQVLDIRYADEIKVLSFSMQKTIARAGNSSWTRITNMVKIQAQGPRPIATHTICKCIPASKAVAYSANFSSLRSA